MRWLTLAGLLFCAAWPRAARADAVGVFTRVRGDVEILREGNYLAADTGVNVSGEDILETASDASAQVDLDDGSILKIGPETRLALSDYRLDARKNVVSAAVDVISGWLRFAVAKLHGGASYAFNTPVLTVGVRGTEGIIDAQNREGALQLEKGEVWVTAPGGHAAAQDVRAGEFIQRLRGQAFARLRRAPPAFLRRVPPAFRGRLARRMLARAQRGVSPRVIRAITRKDAQRFLRHHPYLTRRLQRRFQHLAEPGAAGRFLREHRRFGPGIQGRARARGAQEGNRAGAADRREVRRRRAGYAGALEDREPGGAYGERAPAGAGRKRAFRRGIRRR